MSAVVPAATVRRAVVASLATRGHVGATVYELADRTGLAPDLVRHALLELACEGRVTNTYRRRPHYPSDSHPVCWKVRH